MAVECTKDSDQGPLDPVISPTSNYTQEEENEGMKYNIDANTLKQLILSQDLKTEMSFLLFILAGLKKCGKTDVLKRVIKILVKPGDGEKLSTFGEHNPEGLSLYEFAVARDSAGDINWSIFTRSSGYLHCFLSALVQYAKEKKYNLLSGKLNAKQPVFKNSTLDDHFHCILEGLHWQFSNHVHEQAHSELFTGLSLVNVWDLEDMNEAVMLVLSLIVGQLKHSFAILSVNLEEHLQVLLHSQPRDEALKQYFDLLRLVHLTRGHKVPRTHTCVLAGLLTTSQKQYEENPSELASLMENTKKGDASFDVEQYFVDPWILNANKPDEMKQLLQDRIWHHRGHFTRIIPLSWVLLRSAFFKSGELYVKKAKLEKVASELSIQSEDFEQFLVDFTAMGSIIYNPNIPVLKQYIILNPVDFCYHLNRLFEPRFDGDLEKGIVPMSYFKRTLGSDAQFFLDVLTSSKHAIKLDASSLDTCNQQPRPERVFYFIPAIRKMSLLDTEKRGHSLFLRVKPTFLPNNVGQLITEQLLHHAATRLVPTSRRNVAIFQYNNSVRFEVVSHSDACEIRLDSNASSSTELVETVKAQVLKACLYVLTNAEVECVPSSTEVQDVGLSCATSEEFHSFPGDISCDNCKKTFSAWYRIYSKIIEGTTNEVMKFFQCHSKASPPLLTTFGGKLFQLCSKETDEQRSKLMQILRLPPQDGSSPNLEYKIVGALNALAADKDGKSSALHDMLQSVSTEYGTLFRECFA